MTKSEKDKSQTPEEMLAQVDGWIATMQVDANGNVAIGEIEHQVLRTVLESVGAEFDPEREGYKKLSQPTNKFRKLGMRAVWGEELMANFNEFTNVWVNKFETEGRKLPALKESGSKTSGMRHFFGYITAYAAGVITLETLKERLEIRILNGHRYQMGQERERVDFLADDEAPLADASAVFSARFVGTKSAEAEYSSHSSTSLRSRFSAKADKKLPGSIPPGFIEEAWMKIKSGEFATT